MDGDLDAAFHLELHFPQAQDKNCLSTAGVGRSLALLLQCTATCSILTFTLRMLGKQEAQKSVTSVRRVPAVLALDVK